MAQNSLEMDLTDPVLFLLWHVEAYLARARAKRLETALGLLESAWQGVVSSFNPDDRYRWT